MKKLYHLLPALLILMSGAFGIADRVGNEKSLPVDKPDITSSGLPLYDKVLQMFNHPMSWEYDILGGVASGITEPSIVVKGVTLRRFDQAAVNALRSKYGIQAIPHDSAQISYMAWQKFDYGPIQPPEVRVLDLPIEGLFVKTLKEVVTDYSSLALAIKPDDFQNGRSIELKKFTVAPDQAAGMAPPSVYVPPVVLKGLSQPFAEIGDVSANGLSTRRFEFRRFENAIVGVERPDSRGLCDVSSVTRETQNGAAPVEIPPLNGICSVEYYFINLGGSFLLVPRN